MKMKLIYHKHILNKSNQNKQSKQAIKTSNQNKLSESNI